MLEVLLYPSSLLSSSHGYPWLLSQVSHLVINRLILIQGLKDDEQWLQSGFLAECLVTLYTDIHPSICVFEFTV